MFNADGTNSSGLLKSNFCEFFFGQTTAADIFQKVDDFMTSNEIKWQNCVEVFADRAAAMTGKHGEVVTKIEDVALKAKFTHCSIYREALALKATPSSLKSFGRSSQSR